MNDPHQSPDRNDPPNPGRDPYSDIFSTPGMPPDPSPPQSGEIYDVIDPVTGNAVNPLDPAMMAPPPLNPPTIPGPMLKPHQGGVILTLGVVSIVAGSIGSICCAIFPVVGVGCGVAATIWGSNELKSIDAGITDPSGRGSIGAGKTCGIVGLVLSCLGLLFQIAIIVLNVWMQP